MHAVRAGQRLPPAVRGGQRPGVRGHHGPAAGRASRGEQHHGDVPARRLGQHRPQPARLAQRLQHERQHPRLFHTQRIVGVLPGPGHEFLAGGDGQGEAQRAAGAQQGGEHRAGVGDQRDGPAGQRVGLEVADRAQPAARVDESHAARPAHRHARGRRGGGQPGPQPGRRAGQLVRAAEDHRGAVAAPGGQGQLLLQGGVGHGQQDQIDRLRQGGQGRVAGRPGYLLVSRVDQVGPRRRAAAGHLDDHPLAEAARARAGAHQRHAARLQHGPDGRVNAGPGPGGEDSPGPGGGGAGHRGGSRVVPGRRPGAPRGRVGSAVSGALGWMGVAGHDRRVRRRTFADRWAAFWSAIAARAACQPGMPHTPPPACVAELP